MALGALRGEEGVVESHPIFSARVRTISLGSEGVEADVADDEPPSMAKNHESEEGEGGKEITKVK